ncbi:OmpA family protein [Alteromonas sp. KUL49]|uniref:OmpA family protein n=1 Tax=Alteromonas sp. KUL49 TaxID=2480798 RepID=UPI00102EF505|nr:OmpA family protein [Alteromonas sp. KUL49]TAP42413.1 OmpA family protein [Alteromonas sp. KUL49]GEA10035.1 hypothetical protein KUL49_04100 [Alteromonas sp. KUL49]
MKKHFTLAALTAAMLSSTAIAQSSDEPDYSSWLGISGMHYRASGEHTSNGTSFNNGRAITLEYGYRFTQSWAARAEFSSMDLDYIRDLGSEDGEMTGVDLMYFLPEDKYYLFGGVRRQAVGDSTTLLDLGLGKHWRPNEYVTIITELATYRDLDFDFTDVGVKVGLAMPFGKKSANTTTSATAYDTDNDGVIDRLDQCPMTAAGEAVDSVGCAVMADDDNDGVSNDMDNCPSSPSDVKVDDKGCTVFGNETVNITLRVLFDNESSVVKQPRDPEIVEFAEFMAQYEDTTAVVEGHTSAPGSATYNLKLSEERAEAFKAVLVDMYGIDAVRIDTVGYGETQLLDTGNTADAHMVNRRISVTVEQTVKVPEMK